MDVIFEPTRGAPFSIEVGFFDTVLEIKEKIQQRQGIPAAKQTLMFDGLVLPDELNVHDSELLDRSRITLIITPRDSEKRYPKSDEPSKNHQLLLKLPTVKLDVALEVDPKSTIKAVKERISDMDGAPINRLVLRFKGRELHDHRLLQDYPELSSRSEIGVSLKPSPATSSSTGSGNTGNASVKLLRVTVLTWCETKKIPVEVNASEKVGELRKELEEMKTRLQFDLPAEYFFIYKQSVMDEDRSFRWHHVGQGDTIEIFSGSVSRGS